MSPDVERGFSPRRTFVGLYPFVRWSTHTYTQTHTYIHLALEFPILHRSIERTSAMGTFGMTRWLVNKQIEDINH